jgi:hypothetical protein
MVEIRPQPGPQEQFLSSPADIAVYGGAAGGGKTWALLMEPLRHVHVHGFAAVLFRRTYPEITAPGGMWPESEKLYPLLGATPNQSAHQWRFPGGQVVKFGHMQHEKDRNNWLGAQIPLIGFDQLERFTEDQFFYMLSRNRSVCGVRPYMRATANPEPGWLADLLSWWIDQGSGYPMPERSGRVRWFIRVNGKIEWADTPGQLAGRADGAIPKSVTFVPARLQDNRVLMAADPGYLANLTALPHVEQMRLLGGNWRISSAQGEWPPSYFEGPGFWFEPEDWPPLGELAVRTVALDPSKGADAKLGDYQALVWYGRDRHGTEYVEADLAKRPMTAALAPNGMQLSEGMVEAAVDRVAQFQPHGFGVETNQFQILLRIPFLAEAKRRGMELPLYGINNTDHKLLRIRRLGPPLSQRRLRFANTPGTRLLVHQMRSFPDPDYNDDGPDALEMARRLAVELSNERPNR